MTMSPFESAEFTSRVFYPRRDVSDATGGARDLLVDVPGAQLHVRVHAAPGARCAVLLFHGNGEVVADWDDVAPLFASAGARLAVCDYRGYGRSSGAPSLRAMIDDGALVLRAVAPAVELPIVVMGRSLGSLCAQSLFAAAPPEVVGVILESGIADLRAFIRRRGLPVPTTFAPADAAAFDPQPKLARGTLALLVIHGAQDDLISPDEARLAFATATTPRKELVLVPDRGHNDIVGSPPWCAAIAAFVAQRTELARHP
jgi:pimeloyl-ACP methyl ester carboxylesterase